MLISFWNSGDMVVNVWHYVPFSFCRSVCVPYVYILYLNIKYIFVWKVMFSFCFCCLIAYRLLLLLLETDGFTLGTFSSYIAVSKCSIMSIGWQKMLSNSEIFAHWPFDRIRRKTICWRAERENEDNSHPINAYIFEPKRL